MCNLSEVVLERGIEEGIEQGIKQGIEQGQRQLIEKMLKKGKTAEEIADLCDISVEIVKEIEESIREPYIMYPIRWTQQAKGIA